MQFSQTLNLVHSPQLWRVHIFQHMDEMRKSRNIQHWVMQNLNIICYFALTKCTEYYDLCEDSQKNGNRDFNVICFPICIGSTFCWNKKQVRPKSLNLRCMYAKNSFWRVPSTLSIGWIASTISIWYYWFYKTLLTCSQATFQSQ